MKTIFILSKAAYTRIVLRVNTNPPCLQIPISVPIKHHETS
jgi:hypothetical protein